MVTGIRNIIFSVFSQCGTYKKNGMFREFHAIITTVKPSDLELYRSLLPTLFSMPEQPLVSFGKS